MTSIIGITLHFGFVGRRLRLYRSGKLSGRHLKMRTGHSARPTNLALWLDISTSPLPLPLCDAVRVASRRALAFVGGHVRLV